MPYCPHCETEVEAPAGETIKLEEFLTGIGVDSSVQHHVQLECPDCESVLGYLGDAAATGGETYRGYD
jgi:hypothetical protein